MPGIHAALITSKLVSLHELQEVYGAEDAYDLLEVITVNAHNERLLNANNNR